MKFRSLTATPLAALAAALAVSALTGCQAKSSGSGGDGAPQGVTVTVDPASPSVFSGQGLTFAATVTGTTNHGVDWSITQGAAGGSIGVDGVYLATTGTGVFEIRATSQAAPTVSGTATVTVLAMPPGGLPMTTATRTSGTAPLAVFFDAVDTTPSGYTSPFTWTSGVTQPADLEGATFAWDFGDPASGTWSTTNSSKNQAVGYTAAHVFETPGTYRVTLTVTDTAGVDSTYSQTISVSAFSGTTYYVAASGSDSSDGRSTSTPFATFAKGMSALTAASGNAQLLLRRGDAFTASASYGLTQAGARMVGAYGDGTAGHGAGDARPRITVPELGDQSLFMPSGAGNDWRFVDLDLVGPGLSSNTGGVAPSTGAPASGALQLRIKFSGNWQFPIGWNYWSVTAQGSPVDHMFVVGCEVAQPNNCGMYLGGRRLALLGNTVTDGRLTHLVRVWQAHKAVISHNALLRPGGQRHALKLHGIEPTFTNPAPETRWVSITDNLFQGSGTSQWTVSVGSQSNAGNEASPVSHVVFERNRWAASATTVVDLETEASKLMVRNNVFDESATGSVASILCARRNPAVPTPADARVYNNTVYKSAAAGDVCSLVQTDSTASNLRVRNNLLGVTSTTNWSVTQGTAGAGYAASNNVVTGAPIASVFTAAGTGDFSLPIGSPGVDAGTALGDVHLDLLGAVRPQGAAFDAGAYESR